MNINVAHIEMRKGQDGIDLGPVFRFPIANGYRVVVERLEPGGFWNVVRVHCDTDCARAEAAEANAVDALETAFVLYAADLEAEGPAAAHEDSITGVAAMLAEQRARGPEGE